MTEHLSAEAGQVQSESLCWEGASKRVQKTGHGTGGGEPAHGGGGGVTQGTHPAFEEGVLHSFTGGGFALLTTYHPHPL